MKKRIFSGVVFLALVVTLSTSCTNEVPAKSVAVETATVSVSSYRRITNNTNDTVARSNSLYYSSERFSKKDVLAVLNENGCDGIRIYHGLDSNGKAVIYIVGTSGNKDLLPSSKGTTARKQTNDSTAKAPPAEEQSQYFIIQSDNRCPDICPENGL